MCFLLCAGDDSAAMCFATTFIQVTRERGCNPVSESFLLRLLQEMTSNFVKAPGDTAKAFDRHGSRKVENRRKSQLNFRVIFSVFVPRFDTFLFVFPCSHLPRTERDTECQRYLCRQSHLDNSNLARTKVA